MRKLLSLTSFIALLLATTQLTFAGGSSVQLDQYLTAPTPTIYAGTRGYLNTFGVHVEPSIYESLKLKVVDIVCINANAGDLTRAYISEESGRLLGSAPFKIVKTAGIPTLKARIRVSQRNLIPAGDTSKKFKVDLRAGKYLTTGSVSCGVSYVSFNDPATHSQIEDGRIILDDSVIGERVKTQLLNLDYKNLGDDPLFDPLPIRIQGK